MKSNYYLYLVILFFCATAAWSQNQVTFIPPEKPAAPPKRDTVVAGEQTGIQNFKVYENKMLVEEWSIKNGKRSGTWTVYQSNGVLLLMSNYVDGKRDGIYIECDKNGAIVVQQNYKNDQLNGTQRKYVTVAKGRILKSEYNYKDGMLDGICSDYSDNGYMQSQSEYKMGVKSGVARWFFSNGVLAMEQHYEGNVLNGIQKVYNQQGILMSEGSFTNNMKNGMWTEYHENGKIKAQGNYTNDVKCGEWKLFNTAGQPASTEKFGC